MTATEELRRMLDERGVEWRCYGHENHTWWGEWHAENRASVNGLFLKVEGVVTPEQAIAATLGAGTCHSTTPIDAWCFACSECGKSFPRHELYLANNHGEINFCPNCGRRVVHE